MNYKGSINLLKLKGASVKSIEVAPGVTKNVIVVPVDWNDIAVTANDKNEPTGAYLNYRLWETKESFKKACMDRNADRPDYVAPSHQFAVAYREEFQNKAVAAAVKRLKEDATYMANNPTDETIKQDAKNSVSNAARIGDLTPMQPKQPQAYQATAPAAASGAYVAPTEAAAIPDDLPF